MSIFDSEQIGIIRHDDSDVWISAGPGAGKTAVLSERIAHLILKMGVSPKRIVAVTYTRTMAGELKHRVASALPPSVRCAKCSGTGKIDGFDCADCFGTGSYAVEAPEQIGTLHSLAARWVRKAMRGELVGADAIKATRIVKTADFAIAQPEDVEDLKDLVYQASRKKIRKGDLDAGLKLYGEDLGRTWTPITEVRRQLVARDLVTYDDLLVLLGAMLSDGSAGTAECPSLRHQVEHLVIDEAQDLSTRHWALLVGGLNAILTVAGDDAQSIFSFLDRGQGGDGGEYRRLLSRAGEGRVKRIGRNYRSAQEIVEVSNALREALHADGACSALKLSNYYGQGEAPVAFVSGGVEMAAQRVRHLIAESSESGLAPYLPHEVAVLARTWAELSEIAVLLEEAGVACSMPERGRDRWRTVAGRAVVAMARTADRGILDDADARTILRAFGHSEPAQLVTQALAQAYANDRSLANTLEDDQDARLGLPRGWWKKLPTFKTTASLHAHICTASSLSSPAVVDCSSSMARWMPDDVDDDEDVIGYVEGMDPAASGVSIGDWLLWLASNDQDSKISFKQGHVALTTIHGAKGLEWPAVVLYGASEGAIPSNMDRGTSEKIAEAGRVLYVGMTRACEMLVVVMPPELRGKPRQPSRWLIDAGLVDAVEGIPMPRDEAANAAEEILSGKW